MPTKSKAKAKAKKPKLGMDARIKAALAEAQELDKRKAALAKELRSMAKAMAKIEEAEEGKRINSDELHDAAYSVEDSNGDLSTVICYLEGKHGC